MEGRNPLFRELDHEVLLELKEYKDLSSALLNFVNHLRRNKVSISWKEFYALLYETAITTEYIDGCDKCEKSYVTPFKVKLDAEGWVVASYKCDCSNSWKCNYSFELFSDGT